MGAAESLQRDKLRQEYLANMREQINVFQGLGKDLSQIATKVEVMGVNHTNTQSALEKIEDDMHKVLENQTTPVGRRRL